MRMMIFTLMTNTMTLTLVPHGMNLMLVTHTMTFMLWNPPLSHPVLSVLMVLSTIYLFMKVSRRSDIIL